MAGPLNGVRVVELGTYVAAPALGNILGMLGASVVKVEPEEGDPTRTLTPWSWVSYNWNKKSVTIDLKSSGGKRSMKGLLAHADVFVESLSPRAVKELGLDYHKARKLNPRLVYCSIKGFGSNSSSSRSVGFDTFAQAEAGLMSVTGGGGRPSRVGNPCVDLSAAAFGAVGILSSLLSKPRRGAYVEIPLVDVVVYWNGYWLPYIDLRGEVPSHLGDAHPGFSPYGTFPTRDGFAFIGALTDSHWKKIVDSLGLGWDPAFAKTQARNVRRGEVNTMVEEAVRKLTTSRLLRLLGEGVPCARVASLMDVYSDQEHRDRGVIRRVPMGGSYASVALPPYAREFVAGRRLKGPRRVGEDNVMLRPRKIRVRGAGSRRQNSGNRD